MAGKRSIVDTIKRLLGRPVVEGPYAHWPGELGDRLRRSTPYLTALKGRHAGRRGFVVGNGPSLRMQDLDRLTHEVTIASNKVFLAFEKTRWRPLYYTVVDDLLWERSAASMHTHAPMVLIPSYLPEPAGAKVRMMTFRALPTVDESSPDATVIPFSGNAVEGLYGGHTVTYANIQLAVHLGLDPIYLIGCDHFYAGSIGAGGSSPVDPGQVSNHFAPGYTAPGEAMNPALISRMTRSYEHAQRYAEQHGVNIFNATRGGHLEVFPRVDLDTVLGD